MITRRAFKDWATVVPAATRKSRPRAGFVLLVVTLSLGGTTLNTSAAAIAVTGITEPVADVVLSASVPGIVSAWKFKEGDFVKANDIIIELDNRLEQLEVDRRQAVVDSRKTERDALQTLAAKSSISVKKEELDKAETDFRIAQTELEMAGEQLRRRAVISPCAGTIVDIARDVGEACQAYQPLIRVVDTRQAYFVSNVEAKLAGRLKSGQKVKLEIEDSGGPAAVEGEITYLAAVVDPASGLQKVKVLFDNVEGKIRPGVSGRLLID
jgi:RND family efflux transporter MFP subunit